MKGAVILVIASLGVATLGSMLLWAAPRLFRRRPRSFQEQLAAVSPRPGRPVGPAGGVSAPTPLPTETRSAGPGPPGVPAAGATGTPSAEEGDAPAESRQVRPKMVEER